MELENFKNTWKKQMNEEWGQQESGKEAMQILNSKMDSFEHKIKWRDRREIAACVIIAIVFVLYFFISGTTWAKSGCVIIVIASIFIGYKLIRARGVHSPHVFDHSFSEHLQVELEKAKRQKKLLENVFWWYLFPIYAGLVFFTIGLDVNTYFKISYLLAAALLCVFIWFLNKREVTTYLNPLIHQIRQALIFTQQKL